MTDINKIATEDLIKNSSKDLLALQTKLTKAIEMRKEEEKQELAKKIKLLATESGFTLEELLNVKQPKTSVAKIKSAAPIKYVNPGDKTQTWTGRGIAPKWLKTLAGDDKSKYKEFEV